MKAGLDGFGEHMLVKLFLANPRRTVHEILLTEQSVNRYDIPEGACRPKIVLTQALIKNIPSEMLYTKE